MDDAGQQARAKRFGFRADRAAYGCFVIEAEKKQKIVCIVDELALKTVTNDLENILPEVARDLTLLNLLGAPQELERCAIIYRDSKGIWDGVTWSKGEVGFYNINERDLDLAVKCVRSMEGPQKGLLQ